MRARAGLTLLQNVEDRDEICDHDSCQTCSLVNDVEHVLLRHPRYASECAGVRNSFLLPARIDDILWHRNKAEAALVASALAAIGA